ncbi:hypothetical protein N7466_001241 [Penicillium verhagenii]|uniref:uncharacterized protein n=1 Tax=Penicillium verhagenii TaxID=1562060 RepID=UPI00254511D8|nr:uncharacterized protein N7466_001241 [Penicillium verhagenii]KAJ5948226.1 hypothetical protein N7466_001241 [Penicillium verhagenii]
MRDTKLNSLKLTAAWHVRFGSRDFVIRTYASPSHVEICDKACDKACDKQRIETPRDLRHSVSAQTYKLVLYHVNHQATFSSLRHAAPPGVYVSLAPGDPTLWSGVIFVRSGIYQYRLQVITLIPQLTLEFVLLGPYASAILRFQIRFPDIYPDLPPLVTFATDVFHPLIVPLTTYTFSTNSASDNTVSATDDERLSPGGFSLRHGFPHWFGRDRRSDLASGTSSRNVSGNSAGTATNTDAKSSPPSAEDVGPSGTSDEVDTEEVTDSDETPRIAQIPSEYRFAEARKSVPVAELLDYIRSTFDDESVLDSLPVEVAGNPGAWHAWKAHRRGGDRSCEWKKGSPQARQPGDWHWDGIWARRVQDEIGASLSDPMLFGGATRGGGDEMVSIVCSA